jgi:hypothetical protein
MVVMALVTVGVWWAVIEKRAPARRQAGMMS